MHHGPDCAFPRQHHPRDGHDESHGSTAPTQIRGYNWKEPSEWVFSRAVTNAPRPVSVKSGGYNGVLTVQGRYFNWECEVNNQSAVVLNFSNHVYTGEMCNVFGFYYGPARQRAVDLRI